MAAILRTVLDELPPGDRNIMIQEDVDAEADTLADALADTIFLPETTNDFASSETRLRQNLAVAAEGALDSKTSNSYQKFVIPAKVLAIMLTPFFRRIWSKLTDYCVRKGFIATKEAFDSGPIPPAAPDYFALFIAYESVSHMLFGQPDY